MEVRPRIDLEEDFSDVSGDPGSEFSLDQEDSGRHYVFVHNDADDIAQFKRDVCGYELERLRADGPCPKGMRGILTEGEAIVVRDHILMSCDKAKWEKRQRFLNNKTAIANAQMARARQSDVNLDADPMAGRRQRVGLNYKEQLGV